MTQFNPHQILSTQVKKYLINANQQIALPSKGHNILALDKNESAWGTIGSENDYSLYPDNQASILREEMAGYLKLEQEKILFGNGNSELIDIIIRTFCNASKDRILSLNPGSERLRKYAALNDVHLDEVPLNESFQLSIFQIRSQISESTKILYLCNPNPVSGTLLRNYDLVDLFSDFNGIIVIDEAYIGFQEKNSFLEFLDTYPNLIILQSFSNLWGMAGLRLASLFASTEIIKILDTVRPSHNVNSVAQEVAVRAIRLSEQKGRVISQLNSEKEQLKNVLLNLRFVKDVFPSDANFLLVKVDKADQIVSYLEDEHIYVFNASKLPGCANCIRISVGNAEQNQRLIKVLKEISGNAAPVKVLLRKIGKTLQKASVFFGFFKKIVGY